MSRVRLIALSVCVVLLLLAGKRVERVLATEEVQKLVITPAKPQRPVTLRDRLVVGLQARLKSEVSFVDAVVLRVQNGQLPQKQVDETYIWAQQRAATARDGRWHRPIIYFRPAMTARANALHISL